MLAEHHSKE